MLYDQYKNLPRGLHPSFRRRDEQNAASGQRVLEAALATPFSFSITSGSKFMVHNPVSAVPGLAHDLCVTRTLVSVYLVLQGEEFRYKGACCFVCKHDMMQRVRSLLFRFNFSPDVAYGLLCAGVPKNDAPCTPQTCAWWGCGSGKCRGGPFPPELAKLVADYLDINSHRVDRRLFFRSSQYLCRFPFSLSR